jgi:ATP-dependent DNA helicase RecG
MERRYITMGQIGVKDIRGIGPKKASYLKKIGIIDVEDMLYYYPRRYEDRSTLKKIAFLSNGEKSLIKGRVLLLKKGFTRKRGKQTLRLLVEDETGRIEIVFFQAAYVEKRFNPGIEYTFYGIVQENIGRLQMVHPEFQIAGDEEETGIFPVYSLTKGITQTELRKISRMALKEPDLIEEYLPAEVIEGKNLCGEDYAIRNIHFPESLQKLKEARYRLIFDELFLLQMGILIKGNSKRHSGKGISLKNETAVPEFISSLSYELTSAQIRVLAEIESDMEKPVPMSRLIQGDVGSGKTVVAEAALYKAVKSGYQGVMMAPTELLARQHLESFMQIFPQIGVNVGFLSSSMGAKEKRAVLELLEQGQIDILLGTHAVIQPGVKFCKLGLVITDEQHRFGVNQRRLLEEKGSGPDVLVMSATPIPRTLASVIYGDLDVSIIDELPPGRKTIKTTSVSPAERKSAYSFLRRELEKGRQAYVVAPLIEESDVLDIKSANEIFNEIKKEFAGYDPSLLHGEMKQTEKDAVMEAFNKGEAKILVSTVIVEVGINVPNATVMIIENAERFGLAQLHQLRGRVGRGEWESYCILISDAKSGIAKERASIMEETNDGFEIAERDLSLRGPGEFFGTRQHGIPELKIANIVKHIEILKSLRPDVDKILSEDPGLKKPENASILKRVNEMFAEVEG